MAFYPRPLRSSMISAMTYLDRDPIVKALKEKDLYVKKNYLGKGGIKSAHLVRSPSARLSVSLTVRLDGGGRGAHRRPSE